MKTEFEQAFDNWLSEALRISTLETQDIQIAFDDRDLVERELATGHELAAADREALATADQLFAVRSELMIKVFNYPDQWFERLPEDHYARRFAAEHGAQT